LLKVETKKEFTTGNDQLVIENKPFTPEQLHQAWVEFTEKRRAFQGEYHLLKQPYELLGSQITIPLANPVQETMLKELKVELTTYLREQLGNQTIQVVGEIRMQEDKKMIYTSRDKFDYLADKNPAIKELKDRLGLDTDF
jgi:hypothetical protein